MISLPPSAPGKVAPTGIRRRLSVPTVEYRPLAAAAAQATLIDQFETSANRTLGALYATSRQTHANSLGQARAWLREAQGFAKQLSLVNHPTSYLNAQQALLEEALGMIRSSQSRCSQALRVLAGSDSILDFEEMHRLDLDVRDLLVELRRARSGGGVDVAEGVRIVEELGALTSRAVGDFADRRLGPYERHLDAGRVELAEVFLADLASACPGTRCELLYLEAKAHLELANGRVRSAERLLARWDALAPKVLADEGKSSTRWRARTQLEALLVAARATPSQASPCRVSVPATIESLAQPPRTYADFVELGRAAMPRHILEALRPDSVRADFRAAAAAFEKAVLESIRLNGAEYREEVYPVQLLEELSQLPLREEDRPRIEALAAEYRRCGSELMALPNVQQSEERDAKTRAMAELRRMLMARSGMSIDEARALATRVRVDRSIPNAWVPELVEQVAHFIQLVGPRCLPHLGTLQKSDSRAHASFTGQHLNMGGRLDESVLFHEGGHFLEFAWTELREAAVAWVLSRSSANRVRHPDGNGDQLDGEFIDPYVAKLYDEGWTEVISMGLQHFSDPADMCLLHERDSEHFYFVVGAIVAANPEYRELV